MEANEGEGTTGYMDVNKNDTGYVSDLLDFNSSAISSASSCPNFRVCGCSLTLRSKAKMILTAMMLMGITKPLSSKSAAGNRHGKQYPSFFELESRLWSSHKKSRKNARLKVLEPILH